MEKEIMETVTNLAEQDFEKFLCGVRNRVERVGMESPKIELRYENLSVEGEVFVGSRATPSLLHATLNSIESFLSSFRISSSKKRKIQILENVNGIVKPSRMTLLLGPPGSGKTTFLQALYGTIDKDLRVSGKVTYCGHEMDEFYPLRTSGFVGQHDLHSGQMTVRETLDFSGRIQGVSSRYQTLEDELSRMEKEEEVEPDPEVVALMKAMAVPRQETSLSITDYILKILKLDSCADTIVGDAMIRGISGGEKKRVSIGEILVGPARVLLMDEISTGLDSSTTFHICNYMRQMAHVSDMTMVISLLQPSPETYDLFDDIILLSEGQIVYQGPRENVLEFFEYTGFKCPERKGVADFLQEITSRKDQEQYWIHKDRPHRFVSVPEFVEAFKSHSSGQKLEADLKVPYEISKVSSAWLARDKYGLSNWELLKACFWREWLLIKRYYPFYAFKIVFVTISSVIAMSTFFRTEMPAGTLQDGRKFLGAIYLSIVCTFFNGLMELVMIVLKLPIFYKQRDRLFYPAWAFALPVSILRIPLSFIESGLWVFLTYFTIGFAPSASRFFKHLLGLLSMHQVALSLALLVAAVGRTLMYANALCTLVLSTSVMLGGFIISKNDIEPWLSWTCYASPLTYGQNALVINEFLDKRWSSPNSVPGAGESTVGKVILEFIGVPTQEYWFWVCIGALFSFSVLFYTLFVLALAYLNPMRDSEVFVPNDEGEKNSTFREVDKTTSIGSSEALMVLPIQPISLAFSHVNYFIDMTPAMKKYGFRGDRLQLLCDVSGAFRPGILTAIIGVTGAGKTTLMDVLSGRKTAGFIDGTIRVNGYPKVQETFSRVSGYCEQNDIHSPNVTVYESLLYSAWLRLPNDVSTSRKEMFVEEIAKLVELWPIREALVGLPGINGLSMEQRKRLTIAVELVANPSIIFMDEPTSGLDAKAAAIIMRAIRSTTDTGRTVICTIHQPSLHIFEAFDELLLMKRGGKVIYSGPLGHHSHDLIEYFESIPGVPKIRSGYNPSTWVLEVTSPQVEAQLNVDFAEIYANSLIYKRNRELIEQLSSPELAGSKDLHFSTKYTQPFFVQCKACIWKQYRSYWRNPKYVGVRFFTTIYIGTLLGLIYWNKGQRIGSEKDMINLLGAMYCAVSFLGGSNCATVQTHISIERTVFYHERAARMYSPLAYAIAQVGIEILYTVVQSFIFTLLLFAMFGFEWTVVKFFGFFYYVLMFLCYFTIFGMMLIATTPGIELSSTVFIFLMRLWILFAGFFIPRTQIPVWGRWYYWATPMAWTLYGLVMSQVGDEDGDLEVLGLSTPIQLKTFLKETFGFEYEFLNVVEMAQVGWVLLFFFVYVSGIKYLNFQKR